ncbi:MAG: phage holin family protein [Armatimonadota bacterium]|nr:phage holin family protein [bacterium]
MGIVKRWLIGVVAILVTVWVLRLLPESFRIGWESLWGPVVFVPVLALANGIIGTLLRIVSLPISCITLGLFGFVINAIVFWIAGRVTGANMGFLAALVGSILYTIISAPLNSALKEND